MLSLIREEVGEEREEGSCDGHCKGQGQNCPRSLQLSHRLGIQSGIKSYGFHRIHYGCSLPSGYLGTQFFRPC